MLAAGGKQRAEITPNIPSLAEASGVKDIDVDIWYGMYLPAGAPPALVAQLNADVRALLTAPDLKDVLAGQGLTARPGSPKDLAEMTRNDLSMWNRVVKTANIKAD